MYIFVYTSIGVVLFLLPPPSGTDLRCRHVLAPILPVSSNLVGTVE
jgi:hypothetical protein